MHGNTLAESISWTATFGRGSSVQLALEDGTPLRPGQDGWKAVSEIKAAQGQWKWKCVIVASLAGL